MKIHILGICGTFMGGLAQIAKAAGHQVSGCDAAVYPPMSDQLINAGIILHEGYDANQAEQVKPDIFVIGNAISRGNPLLEKILNERLPYISGPQWLAENILQNKWVLGVAGTHGKTTTASMLTWILEYAGKNPSFLIGGVPQNFGVSARFNPQSEFFVIEADEYDTAFCDKRSKFVHYRPKTAILNNLEFDHADIFADLAAIETQFHHLVRTLPQNGRIVCNIDEDSLQRVLQRGVWSEVVYFGKNKTNFHENSVKNSAKNSAKIFSCDGSDSQQNSQLALYENSKKIGEISWNLTGEHNRNNACAAILAAQHVGVDFATSLEALSQFENVKRRMEIRGKIDSKNITVYDDFAHHPTAITTTLNGLRNKVGNVAKIIAVFEPRSNTMKLGTMKARLAESLRNADFVFCYSNGLDWNANDALQSLGKENFAVLDNLENLINAIIEKIENFENFENFENLQNSAGIHILIMSNGGFGGIHTKLLEKLQK